MIRYLSKLRYLSMLDILHRYRAPRGNGQDNQTVAYLQGEIDAGRVLLQGGEYREQCVTGIVAVASTIV